MLDNVDEVSDRRLAQHLVGLYLEDAPETGGQDVLVSELLVLCQVHTHSYASLLNNYRRI